VGTAHVRTARFVPYYLFTIRQPFEYPMVEMQRLGPSRSEQTEEDT
jgi:hypothetical protein